MKPVLTKTDFVRRYKDGEFGNASPTWNNVAAFVHDLTEGRCDTKALYHIRNRVAGGPTYYNLTAVGVTAQWRKLRLSGVDPSSLYVSMMCPTELTTFQGYFRRDGIPHWDGAWTTLARPMREAIEADAHQDTGLKVQTLLRHFLCPRSYDWLEHLFNEYPEHVVELTSFSTDWGTVPGYNTVFWEVRLY